MKMKSPRLTIVSLLGILGTLLLTHTAQGQTSLLITFTNPTPVVNDRFGASVAALGSDRLVIGASGAGEASAGRSEEHTSELQSLAYLVCRLLLEKKKKIKNKLYHILHTVPHRH